MERITDNLAENITKLKEVWQGLGIWRLNLPADPTLKLLATKTIESLFTVWTTLRDLEKILERINQEEIKIKGKKEAK